MSEERTIIQILREPRGMAELQSAAVMAADMLDAVQAEAAATKAKHEEEVQRLKDDAQLLRLQVHNLTSMSYPSSR